MKFAIISNIFPPEPLTSAHTSWQIVEYLLDQKERVQVITAFPNRPGGKIFPGYHRKVFEFTQPAENYTLMRCFATFSRSSTMFSRFLENISFGLTSSLALLFSEKADVIYVNTWPLGAQLLTITVAKLRRMPFVLSIQDIYPESLVSQKRVAENSFLVRFLRWLDRMIVHQADAVVVISNQFEKIYLASRNMKPAQLHVIPNWVRDDPPTLSARTTYRRELKIPEDAFVLMYGGNIGVAAGVETVVRAMSAFKNKPNVFFVIAGDGSQKNACQQLAQSLGLHNVRFHSTWLAEETTDVLAAADVFVLPTAGQQSLFSVPSKLTPYMLAARPIIAAVLTQSETSEIIQASGCGWVVSPEDIDEISQAIEYSLNLPLEKRQQMGLDGREYALKHFTTEVCLPQLVHLLESVAQTGYTKQ